MSMDTEARNTLVGWFLMAAVMWAIVLTFAWVAMPIIWKREAQVKTHVSLEELHRDQEQRP